MSRDPVSRVLVEPGLQNEAGSFNNQGQVARCRRPDQLPREHKQARNCGRRSAVNNDLFTEGEWIVETVLGVDGGVGEGEKCAAWA